MTLELDDVPSADRLAFWIDSICAASAQADAEIPDRAALFGQLEHLQIADISINRLKTCAQSFRRTASHVGRIDSEVFAILQQRSGRSTISFNGDAPRVLEPGDISINTGLESGVWQLLEDSDVLLTVVPSVLLRQQVGFAHEHGAVSVPRETPIAHLLGTFVDALRNQAETLTPGGAQHLRDGLLQSVAAALEPLRATSAREMDQLSAYHRARVLRFCTAHLHDPALDVRMIASGVQLSASQLHRLFPRDGGGLMHRVWQERLDGSRKMLASSMGVGRCWSIAEVGWHWGYESAAHFSRSFKLRFGVTPSTWRNSSRVFPPIIVTDAIPMQLDEANDAAQGFAPVGEHPAQITS